MKSRPWSPLYALAALVASGVVSAGCGSNSLDDEDHVRTWVNTASAVAVYAHAHEPVSFADGQSTFADPACPETTDDGTTVTITGGCVDQDGSEWTGSATIVRAEGEGEGDLTLTLDGYGHDADPGSLATLSGEVDIREISPTVHEFDADIVHEGGLTTTIRYSGRVEGDYDGPTTWNGSGEVERDGLVAPTGTVQATTIDERLDNDVCSHQPVSGQTTIETDGHDAIVTYDGATDCDEADAARWSVDGDDRGAISGIVCAVGAAGLPGKSVPLPGLLVLGVAGLALSRRRPSPQVPR